MVFRNFSLILNFHFQTKLSMPNNYKLLFYNVTNLQIAY